MEQLARSKISNSLIKGGILDFMGPSKFGSHRHPQLHMDTERSGSAKGSSRDYHCQPNILTYKVMHRRSYTHQPPTRRILHKH